MEQPDVPDKWTICRFQGENFDGLFMRINESFQEFPHRGVFRFNLILAVALEDFRADDDSPMQFEDAVFEELEQSGKGLVAAIVTNPGTRDFIAYVRHEDAGEHLVGVMRKRFPDIRLKHSLQREEDWATYFRLLPEKH